MHPLLYGFHLPDEIFINGGFAEPVAEPVVTDVINDVEEGRRGDDELYGGRG